MKDPQYRHWFNCSNRKFHFDRPEMFDKQKTAMNGKRGYAIFVEEDGDVTSSQRGYLYGGIIRAECMNSNVFAGMNEKEIYQYFIKKLRSYTKTIKTGEVETIEVFAEDVSSYGKRKMTRFIDEVIALLNTEFNIFPKDPTEYKLNRYEQIKKRKK